MDFPLTKITDPALILRSLRRILKLNNKGKVSYLVFYYGKSKLTNQNNFTG